MYVRWEQCFSSIKTKRQLLEGVRTCIKSFTRSSGAVTVLAAAPATAPAKNNESSRGTKLTMAMGCFNSSVALRQLTDPSRVSFKPCLLHFIFPKLAAVLAKNVECREEVVLATNDTCGLPRLSLLLNLNAS